jgi:hypothetical protein
MSTRFFSRHTRVCRDAHVGRALGWLRSRPDVEGAFLRLLAVAHARSDLGRVAPDRDGALPYLDALVNLARYHRESVDPYAWPGATGHPLAVIHSLAGHLLAHHPVPRFLASAWFGANTIDERMRRNWFVQHGRGRAFRTLTLPLAMTRRMEHAFLRSPDHLGIDEALRRAEVLGMGGDPALWAALRATPLGGSFADAELRRPLIAWLVRWRDEIDLAQVGPIAALVASTRDLCVIARRPPTAVWRDAEALAARSAAEPRGAWPRAGWAELAPVVHAPGVAWSIVELRGRAALVNEGRALRHCVATYTGLCRRGTSSIWSLRQHIVRADGTLRPGASVLTIEVWPQRAAIVQLRGRRNSAASGTPLAVVRAWAAREQLTLDDAVEAHIVAAQAPAVALPAAA